MALGHYDFDVRPSENVRYLIKRNCDTLNYETKVQQYVYRLIIKACQVPCYFLWVVTHTHTHISTHKVFYLPIFVHFLPLVMI